MKIAYNPVAAAAVITATTAANDDILFDLKAKKIWAKGLRMGADWADITSKPSSLKNPYAIKFRDINGNEVSYDGSSAKDLTTGTYIAKLPYGFSSFALKPTWGNTIGTSIASWNDSSGGSIDFRKDNPSSGKMSIKVDGRVYVNEGVNPVLSAEFNNSFWGMRTPDGGNDWIRTPNSGLIPYVQGNAGSGHSSLGTSTWYFSTAYIDKVYGSLKGRADTATTADTALSANKLTTARNIALGTDLRGSANFDGSGNITINATINSCQVSVGAKDTLPFKRIAHFETTSSYNDNALLLYISEGYINGRTGICRIEFRTDNIATDSTSITASAAVRWLVRNGFGLDSLYAGYYVTAGKAYIDVYLKTGGGYKGTVIRVLQDSRGSINSAVQLISAKYNSDTDHKEAYSSVEAASTSLYGRDYTKIVSGVDAGTVGYANSTGNASSATKLQTARNLWGQSFDGTADVKGALTGTGSITPGSAGASDIGSNSLDYRYGYFQRINAKSGTNLRLAANNSDNQIVLHTNGNVGIGTSSPFHKLQVNGNVQSSGFIKSNSSDAYVLLGGGGHKAENSLNVANADKLDNWHKDNIQWTGYISSNTANLQSYWFKMYDATITSKQNNDITITFLVSEGYGGNFSIFYLKVRQNGTNGSGAYNLNVTLRELVGNLKDKIVAYYNNKTGNVQLWGNAKSQYGVLNYTILKKTERVATDFTALGTLTAKAFDTVQTQPTTDYTKVTMSRVGQVQYAESSSSSTQTTQLQTARNLWGNLFNGTKDIDGSIIFPVIGDTAISNKISWSGSSDGADIYYQTTAKDQGNLVLNVKDDTNAYIQLALNGTFKSHFDVANSYWTGRSARADKWTTARTLTIGNSAKSVDGSGNVSWTLAEIGAAPSGHTHAWNSLTHNSTVANQAILTTGTANGWKLETLNIANWNTAYNFVNSITGDDKDDIINKWDEIVNFLAGIKDDNKLNTLLNSKLSIQQLAANDILTTKTNNALFWVNTVGTAGNIPTGPFTDHPYALLSVTNYNQNDTNGKFFYRSRLAFSSIGDIKVASCHHQNEYKQDETWYNVLTSKNSGISGSTIKLNGTSITVYSSGTADNRYVKKSGDTMTGALNFANGTWNLVGDDSYMGDCNVSGHFGIKAANTTYPGISFFNNANAYLGSLTAYSGNIKYGAYSLQFLDNGNTSVGASTWTNPFSAYDKNAVKDGQAICVWGQSSHLSNLATDSGDMSLWLKRVNANAATLNMVLDGEYYANGNQRLAHVSEIPNKNSWNYDDRYYTKTESDAKYITDITTSINKLTFTRNGSNINKDITVDVVKSQGNLTNISDKNNTTKANSGLFIYNSYGQTLGTNNYSAVLSINTGGTIQIAGNWGDDQARNLYWRSQSDKAVASYPWKSWRTILDSENYSSTLDSRYYTESEVNDLLSKKLNTSDFNWTNLLGKIVAGNEFNIVNAGFKKSMWFNYLPINDRSKTAAVASYIMGNGAKGYASVQASGFIKNGGNESQLLRADGGVSTFNWSGQSGQPSWLWGGNNQHSYYVYNPSNFRVAYAASAGNADTVDGEHASSFVRAGVYNGNDLNKLDTYSFIRSVNSNNEDTSPKSNTGWYNVIQLVHRNGAGDGASYIGQIALGMTTNTDDMFFRGKRTDSWKTVIHSGNIGSQTVASATKLQTARNLWGQSFNGTSDVNGTIYINNSDSSNGAIRLNNNVNANARISAIGGQVIFNTGAAIRFGETTWDWNKWAGLKYDSSTKTIYLGIADDSVFNANSAQRGGTINLKAGIDYLEAPRIKGYCKPASWLEGMAEERAGIIFQDEDSNGAYYPWIRQKLKDRYYSIGLQSTQICLVGSITSRTDNGYDASWRFDISNGWAYGNFQNADTVDGKHASDFASAGHTHDGRYLKLSGGTLTGGIEIQGTISGSNYASSEGFYTNEHNSLILRGDATYGKSGILFTSSKGTNSINQTSDKGFIQFQSYGGTNTTGEQNKLVIGVGNDSTDMVYIQTPSVTGLKHVVGTNPYTIWDSGNLTKLSQLTNDKGFVTGSVNGKTITINGTSTTWSNTWRPISDDYEKGDASTSLSTLGSLTLYNDLLSAIPTIPTIPNPTNYYWANIKVSSSSSTTTSPTVNVLTATRVCAGHDPGISNSISCSNWFRSSGETGWYSSTYGGGWYMSDKDWIRSWGSKALYVNNTIRSTNYQAMYGSTSVSAAKLESASSLVYGTDTSSNSINSYLRGTTVTLQVKKGTSINYSALQLTDTYIYCNNYCDMKYGAIVSRGNFTVNNNSYLAQKANTKVGIGTSSPSCLLDVSGLAKVYQLGIYGTPDANTQLYVNGHSKLLDLYLNAYRDKYFKQPVCLEFITFKNYAINSTIWSSPKSSKTNDVVALEIPNLSVPDEYKVFVFVTSNSSPNIYASIVQTAPLLLNIVTGGVSNTGQFAIMIWAIPT